jgi:predicted Zn-dependent protease
VGRESYLSRIENLVFGDDPRQGYTVGQVYYHPVLAFKLEFPEQWRIINQRQAVGGLSPNRDAAIVLTLSDKETPGAALDAFFGQQGIQKGPNRGRNLFGFRAIDPETGAGRAEGLITFVHLDGRVYQLMGYTGLETWNSYGSTMQKSMVTFREITDRRHLDVTPKTIDIVKLPRNMTMAEFDTRYPSTVELSQIAIINGVDEETTLDTGHLVKRVVGGELPSG